MKKLQAVLEGIADTNSSLEIAGISTDSRDDLAGKLFIAYKGVEKDAHQYIPAAVDKGAVAVIGEQDLDLDVPYFKVANGRLVWAQCAANWYDNPQNKLVKIGVTGTDGKTTTATLIYYMLRQAGIKVGLVSTVGAQAGGQELDTGFHVTSPDPDDFFKILQFMVDQGETHVVLEVTSHALDQYRYGDMHFDVGVLTNVTHEHLDYHKTFENYREAKAKMFTQVKHAVLNQDDPSYEFFKERSGEAAILPYTKSTLKDINPSLSGDYNLYNISASTTVAKIYGVTDEVVAKVVREFEGIAGRREEIANSRGIRIIIDFAHTPNALESVLGQLRKEVPEGKKLVSVFGCAGLRDVAKRPLMGDVALKLADSIIITAEDPRTENLADIFHQITGGNAGFVRQDDRQLAINQAVAQAQPGDIIAITGKGHEKSMCFGTQETPWSDQEAVARALASYSK